MKSLLALALATTTCAPAAQLVFVRSIDLCAMDCQPPKLVLAVMELRQADGSVARLCRCSDPAPEVVPQEEPPHTSNGPQLAPPRFIQPTGPKRLRYRTVSARAKEEAPSVVILCREGGVYRSLDAAEGFIASGGGGCVLADVHGGRTTAEAITCYDAGLAAP